jgi:hypothetical protein
MKICPACQRSAKVSERIETDKKTKKNWLITFCAKCGYNYELDEYKGKVLSPEEEMNQYPWPENKKYWPGV